MLSMKKQNRQKLKHKITLFIKTSTGFKIVLFFIVLIILSSLVVYAIERKDNQGFITFFDSLWWTIVTISTVGYGDRFPVSNYGRIVAIVVILFGIGVMGTVTGRIASFLMERQMKEEKGLLDFSTMKGHFIICGWKREMNRILYEILRCNKNVTPLDMVLINRANLDEVNTLRSDSRLAGFRFVYGDFVEEHELIRAGIKNAHKVLVLADFLTSGDLQQIDSKTVMTVMSVKNLNRKAYVCAELLDTKFEKYLRLTHCDEILLSRDFSRSMLASASSGAGISHVITSLVSGACGAGISTAPIPQSYIGRTYADLKTHFNGMDSCQLIGVLENTGNIVQRKRDALREAQMNPDISKLIPELKNVKTLRANDPVVNPPDTYTINRYARAIIITGSTVSSV